MYNNLKGNPKKFNITESQNTIIFKRSLKLYNKFFKKYIIARTKTNTYYHVNTFSKILIDLKKNNIKNFPYLKSIF
jgi:hypothetical protein